MRKLAFIVLLLCLLVSPVAATTVYVDFVSGNDSTGDGSAGNPYKTPDGASAANVLTGGDEIRVAKVDQTQLSGTCTFTNGSATVNTSADQSGVVANGNMLGKNSGNETWWAIASADGSSITLDYAYWGTSETTDCYFAVPVTSNYSDWNTSDPGASTSSRLKITGGYDLSTETRTGYTFVVSTSLFAPIVIDDDYIELSYFVSFLDTGAANASLKLDSNGNYIHHFHGTTSSSDHALYISGDNNTLEYIYAGPSEHGISFYNANLCHLSNAYAYGNELSVYGGGVLRLVASSYIFVDNFHGYNAIGALVYIIDSSWNFFNNLTLDTATTDGVGIANGSDNHFTNITISNTTDDAFDHQADSSFNTRIKEYTFSSIGGSNFEYSPGDGSYTPDSKSFEFFVVDNGVHTSLQEFGSMSSDTAEARSGTCVKITPSTSDGYVNALLGTVKVPSTASDLTLAVYMKDDATFNGAVILYAVMDLEVVSGPTVKTMTTSYVQNTLVISASDLVQDKYLDLYVGVNGTAGNVYIDDFSYSQ